MQASLHFSDDFDSYPSEVSELSNGEEIGGGWIAKRTENQINNNDGIKKWILRLVSEKVR
ncbi:MAG: hypothetical protein L6V93_00760 [Clostridiales bacterium]|nr:MAG: hypothetical protein L6V93_00760 [Clostridiales bacterium]